MFFFTECWNWNITYIVLPSKKIQKRGNTGIILAGIYWCFIYKFKFVQYMLYYQQKKKKKKIIVYAFYIDVNIHRFLLVQEFIFIALFVNLYNRNLYRRKIKNRKKKFTTCMYKSCKLTLTNYYYISVTGTLAL